MVAKSGSDSENTTYRTAIVPVTLSGANYRLAHDSCHSAALLWNQGVDFVHTQWKANRSPNKYDIQSFLNSLPLQDRQLHAHTTETIAHDLSEVITTSRTNNKNGMKVRSPWRKKNYRPLSFSRGYGWRISDNQLHLSLGRGRPRIDLAVPEVFDSTTANPVPYDKWGEMQLCWDQDQRRFSLHIPYKTVREVSSGDSITAIDEGIINSMALATWVDDKTIDVTIINGRQARAIKRQRNRAVGQLQHKISKCRPGSKRYRRLVTARKKVNGKTKLSLRDFDHQVSHKAANHVINHNTATLIVGDVRGIEKETKSKGRIGRHGCQQLSQWSRGAQERYLNEKTNLGIEHLNESYSSQTCPACKTRNRPSGRHYRCKNPVCGFTCHRDAVGAINILQKAIQGVYVPIGPDVTIRVTYLRAVERWSLDQRKAHHKVQCRKARALSSAQMWALSEITQMSKPKLANSSTSTNSLVPDQSVAVA